MSLLNDARKNKQDSYSDEVRAIIGEAASEGYEGMLAVGEAIRNRGTLKGVYGVKAKFVDKEPEWVWQLAKKAWDASESSNIVGGATHWESTDFPVPYWAKDMETSAHIGKHKFYRERSRGTLNEISANRGGL